MTVHENEFGIHRDELLQVIAGRDAIVTMLTEKVDAEFLAAAGPQLKIVANHAGDSTTSTWLRAEAGVLATNTRRAHRDHGRHGVRAADGGRAPGR